VLSTQLLFSVIDFIMRAPFDLFAGFRFDGFGEIFPFFGSYHPDVTGQLPLEEVAIYFSA
jgi:hypothetical protein